jgi:hypothetical protein
LLKELFSFKGGKIVDQSTKKGIRTKFLFRRNLPINKGGTSLPINKGGNSLPEGTPFYLNRDQNSSFFLYGSSSSPMGEIGSYLLAKLGKEPT